MAKEQSKGIGGWLIFPIIGLFLSLIIIIYDLIIVNVSFSFWFIGVFLSCLYLIILIFILISLLSIFSKKKFVPKLMICFYVTNVLIHLIIAFIVQDFSRISPLTVGGIIWSIYFIRSERVKNTFVN